jgi:hypothetical protein
MNLKYCLTRANLSDKRFQPEAPEFESHEQLGFLPAKSGRFSS